MPPTPIGVPEGPGVGVGVGVGGGVGRPLNVDNVLFASRFGSVQFQVKLGPICGSASAAVGVGVGVAVEIRIGVDVDVGDGEGVRLSVGLGGCPNTTKAIKNVTKASPPAKKFFRIR